MSVKSSMQIEYSEQIFKKKILTIGPIKIINLFPFS